MKTEAISTRKLMISEQLSTAVGNIVELTQDGQVLVDFPGNTNGPVPARWLAGVEPSDGSCRPVLLTFENGDPGLPIIVGALCDRVQTQRTEATQGPAAEAVIDGRTIRLEAQNQLLLRCGKSSVLLRKDGKIILLGSEIVSRASRLNKIKGSGVQIN